MATIPEETAKIKCFVCGSHAKIEDFGRLGEDINFLNLCTESISEGNFKETFLAGMSVRRQIDPTATSVELALTKAIAEARGHGDLSENAEYQYAKEQQSLIEGKISEIKNSCKSLVSKGLRRGGQAARP